MTTIAGGLPPATAAYSGSAIVVPGLTRLAADPTGKIYFLSGFPYVSGSNAVYMLDSSGTLTRVAGNGTAGFSGDGGPATSAQLNGPTLLTVDLSGNLYILDFFRVRKVTPNGIISTVAGNGIPASPSDGYVSGDGGPATQAQLEGPYGLSTDSAGNLYINTIPGTRKVTPDGIISTLPNSSPLQPWSYCDPAGNCYTSSLSSVNQLTKQAPDGTVTTINGPGPLAGNDIAGNIYFTTRSTIVRLNSAGTFATVAGNGTLGDSGAGGPATAAELYFPEYVVFDAAGNMYFIDGIPCIRKVSPAGIFTTVAGIGDGGPAAFAALNSPSAVARDASGNLLITEDSRVRRIDSSGNISTFPLTTISNGAVTPLFSSGMQVVSDAGGNIYLQYYGILKVDATGLATKITGGLTWPFTIGPNNTLYGMVQGACTVGKLNSNGIITQITAYSSFGGYSGDGGPASSALLGYNPAAMITDTTGNLFISDTGNNRIRRISTNGIITTVVGIGTAGYSGDGALATGAQLNGPQGIAFDTNGNLFIADAGNHVLRMVTPNGTISTVAGNGKATNASVTSGPATSASVVPWGLTSDGAGGIYVTDQTHGSLLQFTPASQPALSLSVSHTQTFTVGQTGTFAIVPANIAPSTTSTGASPMVRGPRPAGSTAPSPGATTGPVVVSAELSTGGAPFSLSGAGWSCSADTCTRSDLLPPGSSYPPISATVLLGLGTPYQLTLKAGVAGGGAPTTGAQDTANISGPFLNLTYSHLGNFYAGQIHATYSIAVSNSGAGAATTPVTVVETLPLGFTLVSMAGTGWACQANTCVRSDSLAPSASYPPITVTVNIPANASSAPVSSAAVSGGGAPGATATDSAPVAPAHPAFFSGEISVSSDGWTYLQFGNGTLFGYYTNGSFPWIYHQDLGWEYFLSPGSGAEAYFYDAASQHIWYTNPTIFPYLYDFNLKAWLYYFIDTAEPGHYSANPRYFANMTTGQIFSM